PDLLHKTDAGVLRLDVNSAAEVRETYDALMRKAKKARVDGVIVSETVTGGVEALIGVSTDELFGPVVTFGLGGIFVEVYGDLTFRAPPFDAAEARRGLDELTGIALMRGVRGRKAVDLGAFVDAIMRVQRLAMELTDDVRELDINPLVVKP